MPLVRVEVRNEYRLGAPELYANANREDPKALLDGVSVAGLVGILRQLGDLAEFAAEVFHGLQEQVMITSSRSYKLMGRVQRIEATLPSLEKLVLSQRSHLHFAYTAGANWHSRIWRKQNRFIYSDLPRFIMDSYENCRGPPNLNLLDKFDPGGPGSCLKRYSDPSFFRRVSSRSDEAYVDKTFKKKRSRKIKQKKSSSQKTGEVPRGGSFSSSSGRYRVQISPPKMDGQTLLPQTITSYNQGKSDQGGRSISLGSRYWSGDVDHVSHSTYPMNHEEQEYKESYPSPARMHHKEINSCEYMDDKSSVLDEVRSSLSGDQTGPTSFCVPWDGKSEILEFVGMEDDHDESTGAVSMNFGFNVEESGAFSLSSMEQDQHENLETLQMTLDGEDDEGAGHFRISEFVPDQNLETVTTNFGENLDGEAEDEGARPFRTAEDGHDYKLESLQMTLDGDADDVGASDSRTHEYDGDYNLETLPTNFDLETQGTGASHSRAAKGDDLNQNLEIVSSNIDTQTQDKEVTHLETAGQMDIHLDSEELSTPTSSNIQIGVSEREVVDQLSSQFKTEGTQMLSGDVQHDEVESETDSYVDALNTVESEYETDVDGPTNQEVEQCSDSDNKAVDNGVNMLTTRQTGSHLANSESLNITSSSPDNGAPGLPETCSGQRETPDAVSNSLSLESCHSVQSPVAVAGACTNYIDRGNMVDGMHIFVKTNPCHIIEKLNSKKFNAYRVQISPPKMDGQTLLPQTITSYNQGKSDLGGRSISLGSRYWSGDVDHVSHSNYPMNHEEQEYKEFYPSPARMHHKEINSCEYMDDKSSVLDEVRSSLSRDQTEPTSFSVTWDGKSDILEFVGMEDDHDESTGAVSMNFGFNVEESGAFSLSSMEHDQHENLETLQMTLDGEDDEGAGHFRISEFVPDQNLETVTTNFGENLDGEAEDEGARPFRTAEDGHDYKLESLQMTLDGGADDEGASDSRTHEYDGDYNLETLSTNFDLETQGTGASHSRAAKGDDLNQNLEIVSSNIDTQTEDKEVTHLETAGQMDIHLDSEELSTPTSSNIQIGVSEREVVDQLSSQFKTEGTQMLSGDVQHDEIESETDNYVDALNTVESEYETDVDGPTNQEVEQCSDFDNKAVDNGVNMLTTRQTGSHSSNSESLNITSSSPDNGAPGLPETCSGQRETPDAVSNSLSLESCHSVQSPQIASSCLDSGSMADVGSFEIVDALGSPNVNSVMRRLSSGSALQNVVVPVSDDMTSSCSELQKVSSKHSSVTSVTLWTNGGLLGLEPSKPPDFGMLNVSSEKGKHDMIGPSNHQSDVTEKRSKSVEGAAPNFSESYQDDRKSGMFMKKASWLFSSVDLGVNLQKLSDSCNPSYADNSRQNGTSETSRTVQSVTPDIQSTRASHNGSNSSRMFELGNRLLMNGLLQKPSLDKDYNFSSSSSPNASVLELKDSGQKVDNQMFSERSKGMLRSGSPFISPSSSPPLGHMKISFHPINGFEAQLQLKFSDGNVNQESGRDTFPSFQLVPEPTIPLHNAGSDSEDDTFYRSSAYESDCLSYQSDSNSELWESHTSPSGKNHEFYDSLHQISFNESVPTSWDTGAVVRGEVTNYYRTQNSLSGDSVDHSQSGHLFDLPSLDTLQLSVMERNGHDFTSLSEQPCPKEPTSSPPPLPPPQWRTMKPRVKLDNSSQFVMSENLYYSFDQKFGYTVSQPKPAPLKQEQIIETAEILKSKKPDLKKASQQKEVNQTVFQKEIEEKDDFLHQIRAKSFSLRRTVTPKATTATVPPTSVQVTAILKKANEIRQAVGSDGEDDSWSDS